MKLATFKIKTMCGKEFEIEAFNSAQAITIWKATKPTELFKSCSTIKSTKEIDKYYELIALSERTKTEQSTLSGIIAEFESSEIYKKFKKFNSFKLRRNGD
jgi:hypothetical protein